ncbi:MAG: hypothetical protein CMF96_09960 [Candidatus Marinimicrobia bacterium]|nr:hypothetical protein [Candidatus Neomarinimicrobiota bacterium]|tara:strand:- start:16922 stop:17311 length:390 start_codon:yes stop_codon:yes gene_type:complete
MEIIKSLHHTSAIIFLFNSILLSVAYFFLKNKSNSLIKQMSKIEWFLSSFLFFLGILLLLLLPHWFQVGIFHVKVGIAMISIGASHYFYKQLEIAIRQNQFPKLLIKLRLFIPLLILASYYSGKLLFNN